MFTMRDKVKVSIRNITPDGKVDLKHVA